MKQYQAQYTLGEVYIRPINGEGIFLYDLGYFVDYKEFKETLIKETGFYPEECYAWYIWDKDYKGEPIIRWINNNSYIRK